LAEVGTYISLARTALKAMIRVMCRSLAEKNLLLLLPEVVIIIIIIIIIIIGPNKFYLYL